MNPRKWTCNPELGIFHGSFQGGQQQRVAVARAIVNQPTLILADEPTGNLDSEHVNEVMQMLVQLNKEGTSILLIPGILVCSFPDATSWES